MRGKLWHPAMLRPNWPWPSGHRFNVHTVCANLVAIPTRPRLIRLPVLDRVTLVMSPVACRCRRTADLQAAMAGAVEELRWDALAST